MDNRSETFQTYKGDLPETVNLDLFEKGWNLGEDGYAERFFEGVSEYFSDKRGNDPDIHAAYFAYLEALEKARRWIGLFNFGSKDNPFIGDIKMEYKGPAIKGKSLIFPGLVKFQVKQRIKVTVAALSKKPLYGAEQTIDRENLQTYLPLGPAPEGNTIPSLGSVPISIYHIYKGLMNNGKETFGLVNNLTKKLMNYNAWDGTLNEIIKFRSGCEEYEFFTFSPSFVGVRLTIPFIYDMRDDLHLHSVPLSEGFSL